jgi:putative ABC transport system substrate-binding protein
MPVIGYFSARSAAAEAAMEVPFRKALAESGFVVGRDVAIEYRFTEGRDARLSTLAAELVARQVALLVATGPDCAVVAKAATATIPIIFTSGQDPAELGLVASLNRPGGNATGVSLLTSQLGPKRLGLLREVLPKPGLIAFVVNPDQTSTPSQVKELQAAAQAIGQPLLIVNAASETDIDKALAIMTQHHVAAVLFGASSFFQVISEKLIALAERLAVPALYEWREFVASGGLMSYSTNRTEVGLLLGNYAGRILKGAKPADLPVVQSTRFELVINLKTAKALGLTVPRILLSQADEVIE